MIYKYTFICTLISVSLITGCAKKKEEDSASVAPISSLEGAWEASCYDFGYIASTATTSFVSDGTFTKSVNSYMQSDCSSQAYSEVRSGTYTATTLQNAGAIQKADLNFTYTAVNVTPSSPAGAAFMNSNSHCGFNDWSSGVTKSVLGANCLVEVMPTNGQTKYDIVWYILDSTLAEYGILPGDLMFGISSAGHDGDSPSARYENADASLIFRHQ